MWVGFEGALCLATAPAGLKNAVAAVRVVDGEASAAAAPAAAPLGTPLPFWRLEWRVTAYACADGGRAGGAAPSEGAEHEGTTSEEEEDGEGGGGPPGGRAASRALFKETPLPSAALDAAWDALILPPGLKPRLARTAAAGLAVSAAGVSPALVTASRLALLHGPPGTGKTSLASALAHRLAISAGAGGGAAAVCGGAGGGGGGGGGGGAWAAPTPPPSASSTPALPPFTRAALVEVRAHHLLSRFFGESAKRVGRAFGRLAAAAAAAPDTLLVVLLDEVDTLASARAGCGGGGGGPGGPAAAPSPSEPGDAGRAVTALLTSLDALRASRPNVLVLATSNLPGRLDGAFMDRADARLFLGPPGPGAAYAILASGLAECVRAGLVVGAGGAGGGGCPPPPPRLEAAQAAAAAGDAAAAALLALAAGPTVAGLSGRALRRLPFLAFAVVGAPAGLAGEGGLCGGGGGLCGRVELVAFIQAVAAAAATVSADRAEE